MIACYLTVWFLSKWCVIAQKGGGLAFSRGARRFRYSLDTDVTGRRSDGDCKHRDELVAGVTRVSVNCITAPRQDGKKKHQPRDNSSS